MVFLFVFIFVFPPLKNENHSKTNCFSLLCFLFSTNNKRQKTKVINLLRVVLVSVLTFIDADGDSGCHRFLKDNNSLCVVLNRKKSVTNKVVVTFNLNAVLSAMDLSKDEMLLEVNLKAVAVLHTKRTLQLGLSDIVARVRGDGLRDVAITNALKVTVLLIHSDSIDAVTIKVASLKDEAIDVSVALRSKNSRAMKEEGIDNEVVLEVLDDEVVPIDVTVLKSGSLGVDNNTRVVAPGVNASEECSTSIDLDGSAGPEEDDINEDVVVAIDKDTNTQLAGDVLMSSFVPVLSKPSLVDHDFVSSLEIETRLGIADEHDVGTHVATHGSEDLKTTSSLQIGIKSHEGEADVLVTGALRVVALVGANDDDVLVGRELLGRSDSTGGHFPVASELGEVDGLVEEVEAALEVDGDAAAVLDVIGHGSVAALHGFVNSSLESIRRIDLTGGIGAIVNDVDGGGVLRARASRDAREALEGLRITEMLVTSVVSEVVTMGMSSSTKNECKEKNKTGLHFKFKKEQEKEKYNDVTIFFPKDIWFSNQKI